MKELLKYKLFELQNYTFYLENLFVLLGIWLLTFLFLRVLKTFVNKSKRLDTAKKYSIYTLIKYLLIIITFVLSLEAIGIHLSVLMAGSAALLVGLGLGIQNLFSDYISGIIILFDSTVKVGDIIETDGLICKVEEINLRTTTVLTRDDKYIILPNTDLTRNQLVNWTHHSLKARFEVSVGVEYGTQHELMDQILTSAAREITEIVESPAPFARLNDFGDSSISYSIYFWTEEIFRVENIKSQLRVIIGKKLNENNISIPFPQRVIHNAKPV